MGTSSLATTISAGAGILSTIGGAQQKAAGQEYQAKSEAQAATYNAGVAGINAGQAEQSSTFAAQAGEADVGIQQQKTRALISGTVADQAGAGIDVHTKSAVDVRASEAEKGMQDALTIRSQAAQKAYGFQVEEASDLGKQALLKSQASSDLVAGKMNASATMINGYAQAGNSFNQFMLKGGLTGDSQPSQAVAENGQIVGKQYDVTDEDSLNK